MEMPGRTRGKTRAMRDAPREYAHRHGLPLDHAALVSMLEKGETVQEVVHEHGASPDLLTARASDLHTPASVSEVETYRTRRYGDTRWTGSSKVFCRPALSRLYSSQWIT